VIASGSTADGCGCTTTRLPATSEAKIAGHPFQVENEALPMTSPMPRGMTVYVFSSRPPVPPGLSHTAVGAIRVISRQDQASASRLRSSALATL
jgi:hypothetical protein